MGSQVLPKSAPCRALGWLHHLPAKRSGRTRAGLIRRKLSREDGHEYRAQLQGTTGEKKMKSKMIKHKDLSEKT